MDGRARDPDAGSERRQLGQALVEVALVVPLLLLVGFGVVGVGRVVHARMGVAAVAREAARAGALADTGAEAVTRATVRGQEVATGYRLENGSFRLAVDPGTFSRGDRVRAVALYEVALDDLPLLGWARVRIESAHEERIELYRSRWSGEGQR
jgi:TadE-like protein